MNRAVFILIVGGIVPLLAPEAPTAQAGREASAMSDVNVEWLDRIQKSERWGRDPFNHPKPAAIPTEASGGPSARSGLELTLSAIIYGEGRGLAIINNQILRVGDRVGNKEVVEIKPDRVILRDEAGDEDLRVKSFTLGR